MLKEEEKEEQERSNKSTYIAGWVPKSRAPGMNEHTLMIICVWKSCAGAACGQKC